MVSCEGSASRITNAARKFAMAFRIPSGNGPDRLSFHSNSICRSLASHCATVLSIGYAGVDVVTATAAGLVSGPVWMAEGRSSRLRRFFAAFRQMSSIFGAREINREKKVSCWERVLWEIGTVLVLGCSGILVFWYSEGVLMGSDAGCWEESVDGSF